jgi:exonuclease SbcC
MLPIRLEIRNFLAYRSPDPLYFDGIHLACLTGANGAGKSSLLDAITWALWGKARARRDEEMIHLGQQDMSVLLDFAHEGGHYRVWRQRTRKSGGQGRLDFFSIDAAGELTTLTGESVRATQSDINRLLRLDYETFINSAFLQQGKADAFTVKAPAERKKLLSDMLGLERWGQYEEAVKARLKRIDETIAGITLTIAEIDRELAQEAGLKHQLEEAMIAQQEAGVALAAAEERLRQVESAPNELRAAFDRKAEQGMKIAERRRDLAEADKDIANHSQRIARFEGIIAQRDEIEQGYAALQSAQATYQSQGDKLFQLRELEKQRVELEKRIDEAAGKLEQEASGCEATLRELERVIGGARHDDLTQLRADLAELEGRDKERTQLGDLQKTLLQERSSLDATNTALFKEMKQLEDRIKRLEAAEGAACPLCGQALTPAHRDEIVAQLTAEGKERGDRYRAHIARMDDIKARLSEADAAFKIISDALLRLPELNEQAGQLQRAADEAHAAAVKRDEVGAVLAAVRATLEMGDFAHDLRGQLVALEAEREALGYDDSQYASARQQLDEYRAYEMRQTDLQIALDSVEGQRAQLQIAEARRDRLAHALVEDEAKLTELAGEIERLQKLVEEYRQREEEVQVQRRLERSASERLIIAQQKLRTIEEQKENKTRLEQRRADAQRNSALHEQLQLAFSKKGIPAMIIETAIPELESTANAILTRMTDGRMHVRLETQREKITGGVAETLDIQIADELGTRSYDLYSGGEAFRINFALRVALSQLLARRAGAHLQTLFIDEGFGTQDEEGRAKLVEAINAVQGDFELILVITHIEDLRDSFPVHILLEKTGDGSRISVR